MTARRKSKAERRTWWAALTPEEQSAYITRTQERKAATPNAAAREASARLDLALEGKCFMDDIPDEAVARRLRETEGAKS